MTDKRPRVTVRQYGYAYRIVVIREPEADAETGRHPAPRRFFTRGAANDRLRRIRNAGGDGYIQRSAPIVWPDARLQRTPTPRPAEPDTIPLDGT